MVNIVAGQLAGAPIKYFADWTERVAKGELPKTKPTRPQGLERNIVVTTWDCGNPKKYLHDLIASDRRYPTVNAYGPVFGSPEYSTDVIPILDPTTHTVTVNTGGGQSHTDLAWQVVAGSDYFFTHNISGFIEYKYLDYTSTQIDTNHDRDLGQHLLGAGVRFFFH